jgi:hypothetical protein
MFRDAAGRQWLRTTEGVLKQPTGDEAAAHLQRDRGAYEDAASHPTLNIILDDNGNRLG